MTQMGEKKQMDLEVERGHGGRRAACGLVCLATLSRAPQPPGAGGLPDPRRSTLFLFNCTSRAFFQCQCLCSLGLPGPSLTMPRML